MSIEQIFTKLLGGESGMPDIIANRLIVLVLLLMTLIQIAPIKIDPWSKILGVIGKLMNKDLEAKIEHFRVSLKETQENLAKHIQTSEYNDADNWRQQILKFNRLIYSDSDTKPDKEEFDSIILIIDKYETYCDTHHDYKNNRAKHAISNINKHYDIILDELGKRSVLLDDDD